MTNRLGLKLAFVVFFTLLVAAIGLPNGKSGSMGGLFGVPPAEAQQKKQRSLFSILFGKKKATRKKSVKPRRKTRTKRARRSKNRRATQRAASSSARTDAANATAKVEKAENAKVVLVVGDFFASRLAGGLESGLEDVSNIVVVNKARGSSGFVRIDIVNWPEKLPEIVEEAKPHYIVVMLGSNDRQQMREDGKRLSRDSTEWADAYQKRVNDLGKSLSATGLPYSWVGLPPVRFNSMNADFLNFNKWYRKAATSNGGQFVDVWDGFSDSEGRYVRSGPDINGQIVLLRPKEGINLTRAGARRLAFYVEDTIKRALGAAGAPGASPTQSDQPAGIGQQQYDPSATGRTAVISLADPALDGGDALAGGGDINRDLDQLLPSPTLASARRTPPKQRADNYRWSVLDAAE